MLTPANIRGEYTQAIACIAGTLDALAGQTPLSAASQAWHFCPDQLHWYLRIIAVNQGVPMTQTSTIGAALALAASLLISHPALAAEPRYNQVALRAEVSQSITHDEMQVSLYSEAQDTDPARLASLISKNMNAAVSKARAVKDVQVSLGSRNSYPVYDNKNRKITGWRERADLRLEGSNFAALSQLTADLLGDLQMAGMSFSIAKTTRQQAEDSLYKDAIQAFNTRANLISQSLGGTGFRLVSLSLNSGGFRPPMPMRMEAMKGMAMMSDSAVPQEIEAGSSDVTVNADGVIEVLMP
jgi:predicted secreted protein